MLIAVPGKQRRRRMTLTNTKADFERLVAVLSGYGLPVRIGFEATGNYHRALAHHLSCAGFELKLVSSVALARTREALHNSWDKNDPKDAQVILHMLQIGAVQVFHDPLLAGVNDIQELSKTHEIVSRAKTELWHRILTHYLPLYFPEADRYHRSSRTDWFLAFLEAFPSPHFIAAMSKDGVHRRGMDRRRAARLQNRTAVRHLRDREDLRRTARRSRIPTPSACSGWSWPKAAA